MADTVHLPAGESAVDRRHKAAFGQNECTVKLNLGHRTYTAVCVKGHGTGASAAFHAITASAFTLTCIPITLAAIGTVQFFVYGTFYAPFASLAKIVCTIGAKLTVLTVGVTAVETKLTASDTVITEVRRANHAVFSAVFTDIRTVFARIALGTDHGTVFTQCALGAQIRTIGAHLTAVGATHCTVFTHTAGRTKISAFLTSTAIGTR